MNQQSHVTQNLKLLADFIADKAVGGVCRAAANRSSQREERYHK
jgi:hypothetical protein